MLNQTYHRRKSKPDSVHFGGVTFFLAAEMTLDKSIPCRSARQPVIRNDMVVQASEIAPAAYASGNDSLVKKEDDLTYDLGNLMGLDSHPFEYTTELELKAGVRENVQLLVNHIFQDLQTEASDLGLLAVLPEPKLVIPREKPVPKLKEETRWEKFAKMKGIQNRKKGRMIWDEEHQQWAPRWGYKRANDDLKDWAIEVKEGDDMYSDPWTARKQAKAERVSKNVRQMKNNLAQGRGRQPPNGIPVELNNQKKGQESTKQTLEKVQFATASMGKFDAKRRGEPERKQTGKRTKRTPVVGQEQTERERSLGVLDRLLGKADTLGKRSAPDTEEAADDQPKKKKGKKLKKITKGKANRGRK